MGLSIEAMNDVIIMHDSVLKDCLNLRKLTMAPAAYTSIFENYKRIISAYRSSRLLTAEALPLLQNEVFSRDPEFQDFFLTLTQTFFTRWGSGDEYYFDLVENLAAGLSLRSGVTGANLKLVDKEHKNLISVPDVVSVELSDPETIKPLLLLNRWLVLMLLGCLFGYGTLVELEREPDKRNNSRPAL